METQAPRPESLLQRAHRDSPCTLSQAQTNAVIQLALHLETELPLAELVAIVKRVHEFPDSYWSRTDLTLRQVQEELFGTTAFGPTRRIQ